MMKTDWQWRFVAMLRGWGVVAAGYFLAGLTTTLCGSSLHMMRESWLDRMVSFDPTAIWMYLSFFLFIALAFFVGPRGRIERLVRAMQICACVACCVFVIFPTSLEYPSFTGNGVSLAVLRALSWLDVRTNCLPSLHAALTTASLLTLWSKRKLFRSILVTLWALAICVSIVQLRRHLAIDVMAGATLGAASYAIAWLTPGSHRREPKPDQALKQQDSLSFATAAHRFETDLRRAATRYLSMSGEDRFGDILAGVKGGALFALLMVCYFGALAAGSSVEVLFCEVGLIVSGMLLAMNVVHDAAHQALSKRRWVNNALARIVSIPVGIDSDIWTARHVRLHHAYANVEHFDLDTEANWFLRQTPYQDWHPRFRYQRFYWPLLAALAMPHQTWFQDWRDRFSNDMVKSRLPNNWSSSWWTFIAIKLLHFGMVLGLPLLMSLRSGVAPAVVVAGYLIGQLLASAVLVALVLGTHWADVEFFLPPTQMQFEHSWRMHAFRTARDWQPTPAALGYWLGGLNLHLTHHLFPTFHHRHYPALSRLVAAVARRHGIAYRRLGYRELIEGQQRFLRSMGEGAVVQAL